MAVKIFYSIISICAILSFITTAKAQSNQTCHWTYSTNNDSEICQRTFGADGKKWQRSNQCETSIKGKYNNTCCCPTQNSPKYIVIGSLVILFGLATTYFLVTRKSEEN